MSEEKQYESHFEEEKINGPVFLGEMVGATWRNDPKRLGIKLSRYKAAAKIVSGLDKVLEIGCADAFPSKLICREVKSFVASDFNDQWRNSVEKSLNQEKNFQGFQVWDPCIESYPKANIVFDAIILLDVLEHVKPDKELKFLSNLVSVLNKESGITIIGMPSLESQKYASELSRVGHVNCQSGENLKTNLKQYFRQVVIFSFNDETIHTGFYPMSHYLFALCFGVN